MPKGEYIFDDQKEMRQDYHNLHIRRSTHWNQYSKLEETELKGSCETTRDLLNCRRDGLCLTLASRNVPTNTSTPILQLSHMNPFLEI